MVQARALIDTGSSDTYITNSLCDKLSLPRYHGEYRTISTFGDKDKPSLRIYAHQVLAKLQLVTGHMMSLQCTTVDEVISDFDLQSIPMSNQDHYMVKGLTNVNLPQQNMTVAIDMQIGNDIIMALNKNRSIKLSCGVYLWETNLGWVTSGQMFANSKVTLPDKQKKRVYFAHEVTAREEEPDVDTLWKLEPIGIKDVPMDHEDEEALDNFNKTLIYDKEEKRCYVTWPWKEENPELESNYGIARKRLEGVVRKLSANPEMYDRYSKNFEEQLKLGIIEKVTWPDSKIDSLKHYIPHHAVIKEDKATTKLRQVYDGSCKTKSGTSLNECLYRGPVILENLIGLILRFRLPKVAIMADIEKAFLQVGLQDADRDVVRFLWLKDPTKHTVEDNIQVFRFVRVPFGVKSSPWLLAATVRWVLAQFPDMPAAEVIKFAIYVDNVICGVDSVEEAIQFFLDSKGMFKYGSMNLREWVSNCLEFINSLPEADRAKGVDHNIMGVVWNIVADNLRINTKSLDKFPTVSTKREVLKAVSSVFDPMGWYACLWIKAKIFTQNLWKHQLNWDDELPQKLKDEWPEIHGQLKQISNYQMDRYIPSKGDMDLICFCDASVQAYCALVYLRTKVDGEVHTDLIYSKARVAPVGPKYTIPKLELLSMYIGTKILDFTEEQLRVKVRSKHLWCDSQCALAWLASTKTLKTFVRNKVDSIKKSTNVTFRYVNTNDNPADLATRDKPLNLEDHKSFWFNGPEWLKRSRDDWPHWDQPTMTDEQLKAVSTEEKTSEVMFECALYSKVVKDKPSVKDVTYLVEPKRYNQWSKLLKVTAWLIRLRSKLKRQPYIIGKCLEASELQHAKLLWDKRIQREYMDSLDQRARDLLWQQLNIKRDGNGLLRCHGRMGGKAPKFLPKKHWYSSMVIQGYHELYKHAGISLTLAQVREEYWIPQAYPQVHHIVHKCPHCFKFHAKPFKNPEVPDMPKDRISQSPAFTHIGVDYFGPLYFKNKDKSRSKAWVALFVCMATRAVHMELVPSMSAADFMLALRKFVARRGTPTTMMSDNALSFKLTKRVLEHIGKEHNQHTRLIDITPMTQITWKFIPELAPWHGGWYERMVGVVKSVLRKALAHTALDFHHMEAVLFETEQIVNQRPLTTITTDMDQKVITPQDFISSNPRRNLPFTEGMDPNDVDYNPEANRRSDILASYKVAQHHLDEAWRIWSTEYLQQLRQQHVRYKFPDPRSAVPIVPTVGSVVIVWEKYMPRSQWKTGRIQSLKVSDDGQVRSATVLVFDGKTTKSMVRAITQLYPLELDIGVDDGTTPPSDVNPYVHRTYCRFCSVSGCRVNVPKAHTTR